MSEKDNSDHKCEFYHQFILTETCVENSVSTGSNAKNSAISSLIIKIMNFCPDCGNMWFGGV
jgi:hypothetical protein